jgi:putative beta-barrel porin BBP2
LWLLLLSWATGLHSVAVAQNIQWGPFRMNAGFTLGADFRDNANTSPNHPKPDVLLTLGPTLNGGIFLPFSGGQEFTLTMAATYTHSFNNLQGDSFGAPLSATLSLPVFVAEWTLLFSDSFSFTDDPLEDTFAVNRTKVEEYANTATASATKQLGKFAVTLAAQRYDTIFPDDPDQQESDYTFSFTPSLTLREGYSVFIRSSYGLTYLQDATLQDSRGYSNDVGLNGQITPSLNGTISLGWTHEDLLASGTNRASTVSGVDSTVTLSYTHPLRPNTTHAISFFRNPGVALLLKSSSVTQATGVDYSISHRLNRYVTLSPDVSWTHLKALSGTMEVADFIQVGFTLQRSFTKQLTGTFAYRYQVRSSNLPEDSYTVNDISINLNYAF